MRRLSVARLALLSLLPLPLPASAADHPAATPAEVAKAVKAARPGDTITLRDGTWRDAELLFDAEGTAEAPITLRAQTPGQVVLTGRSKLRIGGKHLVVSGLFFHRADHTEDLIAFRRDSKKLASHCRLTDCAILDCNAPDKKASSRWVSVYGDHNRVDHCRIEGKTGPGTTLVVWLNGTPNHHRIDHNHFGHRPKLGQNGGETIRVGDSNTSMQDSRTVVEFNVFERCDGEAEIITSKSCENVYRHNTFRRCSGALTLRHGDRCTVAGNFFLGEGAAGSGGVRVIGAGHTVVNNYFADLKGTNGRAALSVMCGLKNSPLNGYFPVKGATVAFNTFVNCQQPVLVGLSDGGAKVPPADSVIANNLIVGKSLPVELQAQPVNFRWEGNVVSGAAEGDCPGLRSDEMKLRRDGTGLWRPVADSPAAGAAEGDFPAVTEDIDGQPRGARKDVGCDQASDAPVAYRPLRPEDVGPSWAVVAAE